VKDSILDGTAIGSDAASGTVRVIEDLKDISKMKKGEILVADMTDPDWVSKVIILMTPFHCHDNLTLTINAFALTILIGPSYSNGICSRNESWWKDVPCSNSQ
jgi:TusA-related sulfurtransferase